MKANQFKPVQSHQHTRYVQHVTRLHALTRADGQLARIKAAAAVRLVLLLVHLVVVVVHLVQLVLFLDVAHLEARTTHRIGRHGVKPASITNHIIKVILSDILSTHSCLPGAEDSLALVLAAGQVGPEGLQLVEAA